MSPASAAAADVADAIRYRRLCLLLSQLPAGRGLYLGNSKTALDAALDSIDTLPQSTAEELQACTTSEPS